MGKYSAYDLLLKFIDELKVVIYTTFVFLNIDTDVVKILMALMFIDTLFGIIKSLRMGKPFDFKILFFGLSTKLLILLIPMVLALVGKGLKNYDFTPMVDGVLRILMIAEAFSIFTSMYIIKTKEEVKNVDLISMLLSSIRKGILNLAKHWLHKIENPIETDKNDNNG